MTLPEPRSWSPTVADHRVDDLHAFLSGRWIVRREIVDHESALRFSFDGSAAFLPGDGGELQYVEDGVLCGNGWRKVATRRLVYRFSTRGRATVEFADGRAFHDLELTRGRCRVRHDCAPDRYLGLFATDRSDLLVRWRVSGPTTAYVSTSRYSRPHTVA